MEDIILTPLHLTEFRNLLRETLREELNQVQPINPEGSILLDTNELCQELGITRPTVAKLRKEFKVPYLRIGNRIRFDKNQVLKALEGTRYQKGGRK